MKMKRLFSFTFAILLAVSASRPALAAENDFIPPEPAPAEEVQLPEETDNEEEIVPPTDEEPPEETIPPLDEEPPEETIPPLDEEPPEETIPPADAQLPDDILPPEDEQPVMEEDLINVTVPATDQMILNPYNMPVDTDAGTTREQIIHRPQPLTNRSSFPVIITAIMTGTLASDARFTPTPPAPDAPAKELFLYAEFQPQPDVWAGVYTDAQNQLLVNGIAKDVITLAADSEGYFRLFGAMSPAPEAMWGDENALSVTIAYTFTRDPAGIPLVPDDTELPGDTELPDDTEVPDDTEAPGDTELPDDTEVPGDTEVPDDTEAPGDTELPDDTEAPGDTELPDDTEVPGDTGVPDDTEVPGDTEAPDDTFLPAALEDENA